MFCFGYLSLQKVSVLKVVYHVNCLIVEIVKKEKKKKKDSCLHPSAQLGLTAAPHLPHHWSWSLITVCRGTM